MHVSVSVCVYTHTFGYSALSGHLNLSGCCESPCGYWVPVCVLCKSRTQEVVIWPLRVYLYTYVHAHTPQQKIPLLNQLFVFVDVNYYRRLIICFSYSQKRHISWAEPFFLVFPKNSWDFLIRAKKSIREAPTCHKKGSSTSPFRPLLAMARSSCPSGVEDVLLIDGETRVLKSWP